MFVDWRGRLLNRNIYRKRTHPLFADLQISIGEMANNKFEGTLSSQTVIIMECLDLVISLFGCMLSTSNDAAKTNIADSLYTLGTKKPSIVLSAAHTYLIQNNKVIVAMH